MTRSAVTRGLLRQLIDEPAVLDAPARVWRDWVLVGLFVPAASAELVFRDVGGPRLLAGLTVLVLAGAIWWRRSRPLAATASTFGLFLITDTIQQIRGEPPIEIYSAAIVLIVPYALFRWGSGRAATVGLAFIIAIWIESFSFNWTGAGDAVGGLLVLLFPALLATVVRSTIRSHERSLEQAKLLEREQLARELHDTIAHHVSAIAIQAQAGQAVTRTDPGAGLGVLSTIEGEASRALAEMRSMVATLRSVGGSDAEPGLAPQPTLEDIDRLARSNVPLPVRVEQLGDLTGLRPTIQTALYRIAQEAITNAGRHARNATGVLVQVSGDAEVVRLDVTDDGDKRPLAGPAGSGFGLLGMSERAHLLGGSLFAGPCPAGGWTVSAVLPRRAERP